MIYVGFFSKFFSPILYPDTAKLPHGLNSIEPVVSMAHPAITTLTGALMHPTAPSELSVFSELVVKKFVSVSKYVFILYALSGYVRRRKEGGIGSISYLIANSLRTSTFIVMTVTSAWFGIGLSQKLIGGKVIPLYRYRVIGFLSGLWAFVDQVNGRERYMYSVRLAIMSYWNTLVKQRKVKPIKNGDVALIALSFACIMTLFELSPQSISGSGLRKSLNWIKSQKFKDPWENDENQFDRK